MPYIASHVFPTIDMHIWKYPILNLPCFLWQKMCTEVSTRSLRTRAPLSVQFLSVSCSFRQKSYQIIGICSKLRDWRCQSGISWIRNLTWTELSQWRFQDISKYHGGCGVANPESVILSYFWLVVKKKKLHENERSLHCTDLGNFTRPRLLSHPPQNPHLSIWFDSFLSVWVSAIQFCLSLKVVIYLTKMTRLWHQVVAERTVYLYIIKERMSPYPRHGVELLLGIFSLNEIRDLNRFRSRIK